MAKPGRKSDAELSVITKMPNALQRPSAPEYMTERQKQIWNDVVESEPVEWFQSAATQGMLHDFCCHRESVEQISEALSAFKAEWLKSNEGAKRYSDLTKMRASETKAAASLATKMRLTNQSRYTPQAAGTASRNMTKLPKPWEM
jgi:hypothetical protein